MSDRSTLADAARDVTWIAWPLMLIGLLGVAAGVIVLSKPGDSLKALAVIVGIFVLVDGIFEIIVALGRHVQNRGYVALVGVLSLIVGIFLIRHPVAGVVAVALVIGFWLIAIGVIRLLGVFERAEHRIWNLFVAVVEVIAGIVVVSSPGIGYATLALLVGISFIVNGAGMFALGWTARRVAHEAKSAGHAAPAV